MELRAENSPNLVVLQALWQLDIRYSRPSGTRMVCRAISVNAAFNNFLIHTKKTCNASAKIQTSGSRIHGTESRKKPKLVVLLALWQIDIRLILMAVRYGLYGNFIICCYLLCCCVLYYIVYYCFRMCNIVLHYIILYYIILYYTLTCCVTLCYVVLCVVM